MEDRLKYKVAIGIDIVEIERIQQIVEKRPRFLERYFSSEEISQLNSKKNLSRHLAGRFAAKEAVVKSMGTGISGFPLKTVSILNDEKGTPYVKLEGKAKEIADKLGITDFAVSISYSNGTAVASAVAIRMNEFFEEG